VRNSPGCCPAFLSAAKAPGVATIWPSSKAGCLLSCCLEKTPFVGLGLCFSEATRRAAHKKQMPFLAGRGAWPSALSRARGFRVYRSEAGDPWQEKRAVQAQVFSEEGRRTTFSESNVTVEIGKFQGPRAIGDCCGEGGMRLTECHQSSLDDHREGWCHRRHIGSRNSPVRCSDPPRWFVISGKQWVRNSKDYAARIVPCARR